MNSIGELIALYILSLAAKRSKGTLVRMGAQLRAFDRYLQSQNVNLYLLNRDVIIHWLNSQTRLKPISLRQNMFSVRGFLRWCLAENYLLVNPFPDECIQRVFPSVRVVDSVDSIRSISEAGCTYPYRNRALLDLVYGCGLRRMEVRALNVACITGSRLRILGKGGKERVICIPPFALKSLSRYVRLERERLLRNEYEQALFLGRGGRRLSLASLNDIFRRQLHTHSPHYFRHACATHMLQNGCDIRVLQHLLGHKKLSTTAIYTHVAVNDMAQMLQKQHPRG